MNCPLRYRRLLAAILLLFISSPLLGGPAWARQLKIATIAPQGSIWATRFDQFSAAVRAGTGGSVDFKIYYGGVMGDDRAMYQKVRIGQLQGAGMTVTGLSEIVPDFRVLSIPLLFKDYTQVDAVTSAVLPLFKREFSENNLELLALTEVGFVYAMSSQPLATAADLKKAKIWIPDGDPLSLAFLQQAGISPIPLAIADVLTSLQTGLIDTVFSSYYGSIVLQWFTKTRYVSNIPFGYAYGGLVLDGRVFKRLSDKERDIIRQQAALAFGKLLLDDTRKSNREALAT
ncbi:MAG: TRAP transporter substrate-binding protein DctP, partial [Deltaproteobacteria bacterium]